MYCWVLVPLFFFELVFVQCVARDRSELKAKKQDQFRSTFLKTIQGLYYNFRVAVLFLKLAYE